MGLHVGRRARQGRIPLPPVEVVELLDGTPIYQEPARLHERRGWLWRLFERQPSDTFTVSAGSLNAEILGELRDFPLLEIDATGRPVLRVLPGMRGDLRIGVSCMRVEDMLADPALVDPAFGGARLPLPYGARLRVEVGPRVFVARVGGPPLMLSPRPEGASNPVLAALGPGC